MKKRFWIVFLIVGVVIGGVPNGLEDRSADLYYDGYLKKIDWENRVVVDWES